MKVLKHRDKQKVLLATPHGHDVSARWTKCVMELLGYDAANKGRLLRGGNYSLNSSGANITNARNEIVRLFLAESDMDWLWFIDTDMTFEPDILDRLVAAAHPWDKPIMGALCFSLQDGYRACPTLYIIREDAKVGRVFDYTPGSVMRVLTGTGCLLIHRTALERMRDATHENGSLRYPKPYEWFQETHLGDLPVGEDITFCIRAERLGIPVHVDTSIKCGHEKPFIVDEAMYLAQRQAGIRDVPTLNFPTFVVIAAKNRHDMTYNLLGQLDEKAHVVLYDNGSQPPLTPARECMLVKADDWPLHRMWNAGLDAAETAARELGAERWNVAILNNDLEVPPGFLSQLESGIRGHDDYWISYPNYHGSEIPDNAAMVTKGDPDGDGRSLCGWAFMVKGESGLRFDEQFQWWYGDSDIQRQTEAAGKHVVCVGGCHCRHLEPNKSTREDPLRIAQAIEDEAKFAKKWDLDINRLFLTANGVTV